MSRMQTHISFEELDDFVQITSSGKWEYLLSVAFPDVVLSSDMVVTLCVAIKQSVKQVTHDATLVVELDCTNGALPDDSFRRILAEAAPNAIRKSGRVAFGKLLACGNLLTEKSLDELASIAKLNKDAKYKYKRKEVLFLSGCSVDLSWNQLSSEAALHSFFEKVILIPNVKGKPVSVNVCNNRYNPTKLRLAMMKEEDKNSEGTRLRLLSDSFTSQQPQLEDAGFVTPPSEPHAAASSSKSSSDDADVSYSVEEMTKALLAGLKISPPPTAAAVSSTTTPIKTNNSEDISRSLLNLLHAKQKDAAPFSSSLSKNVQNLFDSSSKSSSSAAAALVKTPPPNVIGMSLTDLEASLLKQPATSSASVSSPPVAEKRPFTTVRVPLKVFTPFLGASPLCGLELRVDPLGYRVMRVTEKPGQDGNIREGDVITAIDGEPLVSLPGIPKTDREKVIRSTFGRRLKDGVQLIIQRPHEPAPGDLNPDPDVPVERKLDFGLMLLGAGIDWRSLISKFPLAAQQANVVCQSFGIEGKLETISPESADGSPVLHLNGPAGLVDQAMRQFCVVIVKGALLQQQQLTATAS